MKNFLRFLLFLYLAFLLRLTVFREGIFTFPLFSHGSCNFSLFSDLLRIYHNSPKRFCYLFFGNIFTFLPFGFLVLPLLTNKKRGQAFFMTLACGFFLSLCIELAQWVFGVGVSELDDLLLNTFGVFLGELAVLPFTRRNSSERSARAENRS